MKHESLGDLSGKQIVRCVALMPLPLDGRVSIQEGSLYVDKTRVAVTVTLDETASFCGLIVFTQFVLSAIVHTSLRPLSFCFFQVCDPFQPCVIDFNRL